MQRNRHRPGTTQATKELPPLVHLWMLRLLVPLGGQKRFVTKHGFIEDEVAEALGLGDWIDPESFEFNAKAVRAKLRLLHEGGEERFREAPAPTMLAKNVERFAVLAGLSATDCRILEFAVLIHTQRLLDHAGDFAGNMSSTQMTHVLAQVLDLTEKDIQLALDAKGLLTQSGLLSVDRSVHSTLSGRLNLLSDSFADRITSWDADPVDLLRDTVVPASAAQLVLADYPHIEPQLAVLQPYLRHAVASGRKGVNVYLHGDPGTGKSQLVRALAQELGCELFEVANEDADGDPISGEKRLRAFKAAQSFFTKRRAIILFDEVEDVFDDGDSWFGRKSVAQTHKAWINRALEENAVPTLWLSNTVRGLDAAFIRRFDMVFELPVPPKRQRERIIGQACEGILDAAGVARIAESDALSPAVVARASAVVRSIQGQLGSASAADAVELLIGNTLEAQGHRPIRRNDPTRLPEIYDPAFIHADADLVQVAAGLVQAKAGRLCLYGPPGTGKTAYARWVAEQMGVPLIVKRASDLMSMWVGGNEKNIARAFRDAEREGALLLIDEVDSFLQDRRGAHASWEVSSVNEMLTQMESFAGVFIASTNLMDGLDQASLRRFDLKVKFDFLEPAQASELLLRHCGKLGLTQPGQDEVARLHNMPKLTPGDFAAVIRQSRFRPIASAADLVKALEAECAVKEGARAAMGFLH